VTGDTSQTSPLVPGYRLDRYELLCPIAEGGMASVWVARLRAKHGFEKLVAIKTILPKHAEDPRFQQMFLDEARIASRIDHVHVAHVLDLGDEHGVLYLVMEWVDGDSLSKLQRALKADGGVLPLGIALRIVADACAGLHAAHELHDADGKPLGVVHRDVSPQNVLIGASGVVKVIDFGIAKARDRLAGETSTGSLKGKIQFMSPEQAMGKAIDRRADVWSTGSLLYTLLSGEPPFDDANQYATLHRIASGARPPPLPRRIPTQITAIVEKALAFAPEDRFATMAAMQLAIESAIDELRMPATAKDLAEIVKLHLSARSEQRRKSVDLALRAAAERDRVHKLLVAPSSEPSPVAVQRPSVRTLVPTVPDHPRPAEATSPSIRSLGPSSLPNIPVAPPSRRRLVFVIVALSGALALFGLGRLSSPKGSPRVSPSASPVLASAPGPTTAPALPFAPVPGPVPAPVPVATLVPSGAPASNAPPAPPRPSPRKPPPPAPPQPPPAHPHVDYGF
jgi:serine/threonine protein kinase